MRISRLQEPYVDQAEGDILVDGTRIPYSTEIMTDHGCSVVFWTGGQKAIDHLVYRALHELRRHRDIVLAQQSTGWPSAYWSQTNYAAGGAHRGH